MASDRALRAVMLALALLDLVFVHLTEAAGLHWLAPLAALTVSAPALERFRDALAYRALWNVAVVAVCGLLIAHVLGGRLELVLEAGLVLAVLCQVHLLNNLRPNQRPDLFFFNAFLIAIVAGYLCNGVGFPLVFAAFAPCFVIGLQLLSASHGGAVWDPRATRRLVLDGAHRSLVLLALAAAVFLGWPRDFQRRAFFHERLELGSDAPEELEVGFSESLDLERRGPVGVSDEEVVRVTLVDGSPADVPLLWRGATLGATTGGAWKVGTTGPRRPSADSRWRRLGGKLVRDGDSGVEGPRLEVLRRAQQTERLFMPLGALRVEVQGASHRRLRPQPDGTVDVGGTEDVRYVLRLPARAATPPGGALRATLPPELEPYVGLPTGPKVERAVALAARLARDVARDAAQHVLVERFVAYLEERFVYVPPGGEGAADSLDAFLAGDGGGHCEFFASALATMLRSRGVPCRVVTGYRASGWDPTGRELSIRARDAHAWVEVHDPSAGWYAADPSPLRIEHAATASVWTRWSQDVRAAWTRVTGFDAAGRAAALAWLRDLPGALVSGGRMRPLVPFLVLAALVTSVALLVRRRRSRAPVGVRAYRSALRRARLTPRPGETPRELVARAQSADLDPDTLTSLVAATEQHEAERYAA